MTKRERPSFWLLAALAALLLPLPCAATTVWVASLPAGETVPAASFSGAPVLDRFPGGIVVGDERAAAALAASGYPTEGPIPLSPGRTVTILCAKGEGGPEGKDVLAALAGAGAAILWQGGRAYLVESDGPLPPVGPLLRLQKKVLRTRPIRPPVAIQAALAKEEATSFSGVIGEMTGLLQAEAYLDWIEGLSGAEAVTVGGETFTFHTRYTPSVQCDSAEQYVYERFIAMGFTDVRYDPYSFSGVSARNVIATHPGWETPGRVYILCGHLDAISPQAAVDAPGANDNASGVATVLAVADVLKEYRFRSTIRFIAFTGEEQGLRGSIHYASQAAARGDSILGVVNCDMVSWYDNNYKIDIEGEPQWDWLMQIMKDACDQFTSLDYDLLYSSWGSDHVPFQDEGFPAFLAIEDEYGSYPCYHSTCDTAGLQIGPLGLDVSRACLATIAHLAGPLPLVVAHEPLPRIVADGAGPYEVRAEITSPDPLVADSLLLHYSAGGPFVQVPLLPAGAPGGYHAFIPGQAVNAVVTYYLTAEDSAWRRTAAPYNAPAETYGFLVGVYQTIFFEDFEGGPGFWTHGGVSDDWELAAPLGLAEDPSGAYSGSFAFGNDLTGLGAFPGRYENGCENFLMSPMVDCADFDSVRLSFRRWLTVEGSDTARVWVGGTNVWSSPAASGVLDGEWVRHEIDVSSAADGDSLVFLLFMMQSDGSGTLGGWTIDDIRLTGIGACLSTEVAGAAANAPDRILLLPNRPNPFNPATTIRYDLSAAGSVRLTIYDITGRMVRTLFDGSAGPGLQEVVWDGRTDSGHPSPSGVYLCRIEVGSAGSARKILLLR